MSICKLLLLIGVGGLTAVVAGCASTASPPPAALVQTPLAMGAPAAEQCPLQLVAAEVQPTRPPEKPARKIAYGQRETLPVDLSTVLRLTDANNPAIGFAQARVREAEARLRNAEVQWLPNLSIGATYLRFDGQTQSQDGDVFSVSRANLFGSAGPTLTLDLAEAIYRPLVERRAMYAELFRERAVNLSAQLDGVNAYLDLLQLHMLLAINAETLAKAELMLKAAQNAKEAKLDRTAGDVNRAEVEVAFRKTERLELEGRTAAASARLGRLLLLPPNVKLVPAETSATPIILVDPDVSLDQLVASALASRPDLAAHQETIAAAWARVRRAEHGPLFPKLALANQTGLFGGGRNDDLQDFESRNTLGVQLYWEVKNLGFGNHAEAAERRAVLDQAQFVLIDSQARAAAEIVETALLAAAKYESLALAEQGVKSASELYRISKEGTFNVVDAKNLFDALRPLQAIQVLNQSQQAYLAAVLDFNRAQYRLFTLIGNAPCQARQLPATADQEKQHQHP